MTLQEIADICRVSVATVSLVLNNKPGVSDKTRIMVQEVLAREGYQNSTRSKQPFPVIKFLKYKESGMVVEENGGFISSILDQISDVCIKKSLNLQVSTFSKADAQHIFESINMSDCIGVILLGTELSEDVTKIIGIIKKPLIVLDNYLQNQKWDCVVMNNHEIAWQAVSYLASLNFSRIGYLRSSVSISNFFERSEGYFSSMSRLGLEVREEDVYALTPTLAGSYSDMNAYLSVSRDLPKAFFADNDTIAIGAIRAIIEHGYKVPEDVSVVGVDDIPYCAISMPTLTTVRIDREMLGSIAVEMLCHRIHNTEMPTVKIQTGGTLVIRDSVAPNI